MRALVVLATSCWLSACGTSSTEKATPKVASATTTATATATLTTTGTATATVTTTVTTTATTTSAFIDPAAIAGKPLVIAVGHSGTDPRYWLATLDVVAKVLRKLVPVKSSEWIGGLHGYAAAPARNLHFLRNYESISRLDGATGNSTQVLMEDNSTFKFLALDGKRSRFLSTDSASGALYAMPEGGGAFTRLGTAQFEGLSCLGIAYDETKDEIVLIANDDNTSVQSLYRLDSETGAITDTVPLNPPFDRASETLSTQLVLTPEGPLMVVQKATPADGDHALSLWRIDDGTGVVTQL